jgi:tetratricopeptide (TPR) repeat protein
MEEPGADAEQSHLEAAKRFVLMAEQFGSEQRVYEAEHQFIQAAAEYVVVGDKLAAIRCYLRATELALANTLAPQQAWPLLDRADQLAGELATPELRFDLALAHARLAFATLDDAEVQRLLAQAKDLLIAVDSAHQRATLWHTLGIEHATLAMVWEEWEIARQILDEALANCPENMARERFDLLQCLLQLTTERGDWSVADQIFRDAQALLATLQEPALSGRLLMQYGASLARRGDIEAAYVRFMEAIQQVDGSDDAYASWRVYENTMFMLLRNGPIWPERFDEYERRRLDLFRLTQYQNLGLAHEARAIEDLNTRAYRGTLTHLRLALSHYWRDGQWSGIERVYKLFAQLWAATNDPVEALLAAVHASDREAAEQHSRALLDIANRQQLVEVIDALTSVRPAVSRQRVATRALGLLADLIPPALFERTVQYLYELLQGPRDTQQQDDSRRYAAEALRNLAPQYTSEYAEKIVRLALHQVQQPQSREVVEALLKLLNACVVHGFVDPVLHSELADILLTLAQDSYLQPTAEHSAVNLARAALPDVKSRIVTYLRSHPDSLDRVSQLAFLDEPLALDQVTSEIDRILRAIRPQPEMAEAGGAGSTTIALSSVRPYMLISFNDLLTPALAGRVVEGLIASCLNEHTPLWVRNDALRTLAALPTMVLRKQAREIVGAALEFAQGILPRSSLIEWELDSQSNPFSNVRMNTGSLEQVRQSALNVLGKVYGFVGQADRERIDNNVVAASRDEHAVVRQGAAMALEAMEHDQILPRRILLRLFALLQDVAPEPRAWTGYAAGHLIAHGLAGPLAGDLFEELLHTVRDAREVEVRVGGVVGLRVLVESFWPDASAHARIVDVLEHLTADVSYRVRTEAALVNRLLAAAPSPDGPRARARAVLKAAGLLSELGPDLRRRANPFVAPERVQEAMERAGKQPLSELILAERGSRE